MKELYIDAKLENMPAVFDFINEQLNDIPSKLKNKIIIAVDEIFSNIARYAYRFKEGRAVVRIEAAEDISIEFEDCGVAYNPLLAETPDTTLSAEDREVGGLGIFMVKQIMDSVEYRRDGNKNILTIKKKLEE
jgi:anti-sigma regulatory factor (Ser/Thr protein kinase)